MEVKKKAKKLINYSELSRHLGYDRSAITSKRCPKHLIDRVNSLVTHVGEWIDYDENTKGI